jgi:hypothetical protein
MGYDPLVQGALPRFHCRRDGGSEEEAVGRRRRRHDLGDQDRRSLSRLTSENREVQGSPLPPFRFETFLKQRARPTELPDG